MEIIPKKKAGRPTKRPEPELLVALYADHTAKEIASVYDVSEITVRSWVSRLRKAQEKGENKK